MIVKPYTMSSEQCKALFDLLYSLNLAKLESQGIIQVNNPLFSPSDGKIIWDMFFDDNFCAEEE